MKKPIWVSEELHNKIQLVKLQKKFKSSSQVIEDLINSDEKVIIKESVTTKQLKHNDSNI